jgi:CBS domain-containing protein
MHHMPTVARDLMERNTLMIPAAMPLAEIQHLFVVAGIYGAPVIDTTGAVVGVISAIDLLRAADQALDEDFDPGESVEQDLHGAPTAQDIASPDPIWVSPNTPVDRVAQLMQRERIHRVLVGEAGNLEGILTAFDLLEKVRA